MYTYGYAKTTAERELWKFTDEHPDLDVTSRKSMLICICRGS